MTEERKEELSQLLNEAIGGLTISPISPNAFQLSAIDVDSYRQLLQQERTFV